MVKLIDLLAGNSRFSLESTLERQDRQVRIWGEENQKKLHDAKVLVLGDGLTAEKILAGLAGLGVGNIIVMGNTRYYPETENSFLAVGYNFKTRKFAKSVKKINHYVNARGIKSFFSKALLNYFKFFPQVVIDATNDEFLKKKSLEYICNSRRNPLFISAYVDSEKIFISRFEKNKSNYEDILNNEGINRDTIEGGAASGIAAGIILEELRKHFFRLSDSDKMLSKRINFQLFEKSEPNFTEKIRSKKCIVLGAGGIGTYAALDLVLEGFRHVDILDYDVIDESNLNRQIFFYEKLGELKAKILSKRIKKIKKIKSKAFFREEHKIDLHSEKFFKKHKYDILFGCFDNLRARYILNEIALKHDLIYIDGSTSPFRGSVVSYVPGKSSCVSCNRNLKLVEEVRRSCGDADPGVVMSNMVIGGAMVGEALNMINGCTPKKIIYDSNHPSRIYSKSQSSPKPECKCSLKL